MYAQVEEAAAAVRRRCGALPETAIVLGSGLGDFVDRLHDAVLLPYAGLPHWPASTVAGHAGWLAIGGVAGRRVAVLAGRAHFYEGHDLATVVFATRVMGRLGVRQIILPNAAGGINTDFSAGALMVIDDHINLLGSNPLVGANDERFGPRFPDMSEVYSPRLRGVADVVARDRAIPVVHERLWQHACRHVRDARDPEHLHAHVAGGDRLGHGGHADRIRADCTQHSILGPGFVVRPCHRRIDAAMRDKPPIASAGERPFHQLGAVIRGRSAQQHATVDRA
jgi:inosine/guanosine/xanthosine phosphorylase family protein